VSLLRRLWSGLARIGCVGHHRFWRDASGPCICGQISRVVLHPIDWETIKLSGDSWGRG
jgi:hypothetical protein